MFLHILVGKAGIPSVLGILSEGDNGTGRRGKQMAIISIAAP